MHKAGKLIDSQALYERQQFKRRTNKTRSAPIIIATGLRAPDNIAAVLRLADAADSSRVIFVTEEKDQIEFDHKIRRLSRNTDTEIRIEQYPISEFLNICENLPELIAIEITTKSSDIFKTELTDECCLVIGSENHGVNEQVLAKCNRAVHIPMYGNNGSMNVTHALAISLFEWRRQRELEN